MIKFPFIAIPAFLLIAFLAWNYNGHRKTALRDRREAQYLSTLATYSNDFKPGQTRAQIEAALQSRGTAAEQVHLDTPSWDKVIKLGQEHSEHWYCSHDDVDVRLHFAPSGPTAEAPAKPGDQLTLVTLYRRPRNCL